MAKKTKTVVRKKNIRIGKGLMPSIENKYHSMLDKMRKNEAPGVELSIAQMVRVCISEAYEKRGFIA